MQYYSCGSGGKVVQAKPEKARKKYNVCGESFLLDINFDSSSNRCSN